MNLSNNDWESPYNQLLEISQQAPLNRDLLYKKAGEMREAMLNTGQNQVQNCIEMLGSLTLAIAIGKSDDALIAQVNLLQKSVKKLKIFEKKA